MKPTFEGRIQLNEDLSLYVRQFGQSANDLVFIHGGPDWDHSYFLPSVLSLANKYRLTFFDLRGCGLSTKFQDCKHYSLKQAADDVGQLIQVLGLKSPVIIGFSYGGRVLMECLSSTSIQVRAAILASTAAYTDFQNILNEWDEYRNRQSSEMKEKINLIFSNNGAATESSRQLAFLTAPLDIWNLKMIEDYNCILNQIKFSDEWMKAWKFGLLKPTTTNYEKVLSQLKCPILILHGEKDMRFPVAIAQRLHSHLPGSQLQILKVCGHMAHFENPHDWNKKVQDFLETIFN